MEVVLGLGAPRTHGPPGCKQRGAQSRGECPKRPAIADGASVGDAIKRIRGNELGVHDAGDGRRQGERRDLRRDITRDKRDGRWQFRHHPLGLLAAFHAALAASVVLGNGTHRLDGLVDISGHTLAVSTPPALQIATMVGVPDAPETRLDLCTLLRETLVRTTGRVERLRSGLQAPSCFWGTAWTTL